MKAIRTRYRAASRDYVATDCDGNRAVIPARGQYVGAHRAAAVALILEMGWEPVVIASGVLKHGEEVHVMLPRMGEAAMREVVRAGTGTLFLVEAR